MPREILDPKNIHPSIQNIVSEQYADIIAEVKEAVAKNAIVIVAMAQKSAPKRARKIVDELNINYHYLEYGSYAKEWRRRNALKMWTGWSTFPIVFVKGTLIGGFSDMRALIDAGELEGLLTSD